MSGTPSKDFILQIGTSPDIESVVSQVFGNYEIVRIGTIDEFMGLVENKIEKDFIVILCDDTFVGEVAPKELAQSLRMNYETLPIYFITKVRTGFERKSFVKNGFDDAFLMPIDRPTIISKLEEQRSLRAKDPAKVFKSMQIIDVAPGDTLEFNIFVFLPMNKKYVLYAKAGEVISAERLKRLEKFQIICGHISVEQMDKFYSYAAKKVASAGNSAGMSETERREKVQGLVRNIVTDIFNNAPDSATIDGGREIMKECANFVDNFILNAPPEVWYDQLKKTVGKTGEGYDHASNVATIAALVAIGIGESKPQDMAVAGLFHDLGLADVPAALQKKPYAEMTADEKKIFALHPEISINVMKERKLIVPNSVTIAILQHHEKHDGTGFPKALSGERIKIESKILAFADRFDELTAVEPGKKALSPVEALKKIRVEGGIDPDFMARVAKVFPEK